MYEERTTTKMVEGGDAAQVVADGGQPVLDRIIAALADEQRRYLLSYLVDTEVATLEECVTAVTVQETWCPPEDISPETRQRVKKRLHHQHLPKLTDLEIIEYDQQSHTVRCERPPSALDDFLGLARDIETD